ncbi:hypothetical protein CANCADRAFT_32643 [Tortispora caseinolytica NRRL Y-17796]|uniref:Pali-domain-containing protein n=1 Tax=Tortispora caseinolytica NRRL Y-17796 TaxID=767744 RepID=A0A1E4TC69_9ASCO|nr:hypothetical protein CANCADRAFT_32643 [Tortispora caseinolytica NRRL Y-17796]
MRFRTATPLLVLLTASFAMVLIAVLSVPVTNSIVIAQAHNTKFGVFGYCTSTTCSSPSIGYSIVGDGNDFSLPSNARHSLTNLLIVHPIALAFILVLMIMAIAVHFHSPSFSSAFMMSMIVLSIISIILTLLAFLVDLLIFIPHLSYGGWLVLAATILQLISFIFICAMRRSVVARKATERRIQDPHEALIASGGVFGPISGGTSRYDGGVDDSLPEFAELEIYKTTTSSPEESLAQDPRSNGGSSSRDGRNYYAASESPSFGNQYDSPYNNPVEPVSSYRGFSRPPPLPESSASRGSMRSYMVDPNAPEIPPYSADMVQGAAVLSPSAPVLPPLNIASTASGSDGYNSRQDFDYNNVSPSRQRINPDAAFDPSAMHAAINHNTHQEPGARGGSSNSYAAAPAYDEPPYSAQSLRDPTSYYPASNSAQAYSRDQESYEPWQPDAQPGMDSNAGNGARAGAGGYQTSGGMADYSREGEPYGNVPRSPSESESSQFTSISQRAVNPRYYQGGMPHVVEGYASGAGPVPFQEIDYPVASAPPSRPIRRPNVTDVMLDTNPDFTLPGLDSGSRRNKRYDPRAL